MIKSGGTEEWEVWVVGGWKGWKVRVVRENQQPSVEWYLQKRTRRHHRRMNPEKLQLLHQFSKVDNALRLVLRRHIRSSGKQWKKHTYKKEAREAFAVARFRPPLPRVRDAKRRRLTPLRTHFSRSQPQLPRDDLSACVSACVSAAYARVQVGVAYIKQVEAPPGNRRARRDNAECAQRANRESFHTFCTATRFLLAQFRARFAPPPLTHCLRTYAVRALTCVPDASQGHSAGRASKRTRSTRRKCVRRLACARLASAGYVRTCLH